MTRRRRGSRRASLLEDLLRLPWQFNVGLGVVAFIFFKSIFPAISGGNMFLQPIAAALSTLAWFFAGIFFLMAAVVFAKKKLTKGKTQATEPTSETAAFQEAPRKAGARVPSVCTNPNGESSANTFDKQPTEDRRAAESKKPKPTEWTLEVIRDLEWKRFEDVCQQYYERKGIRSETTDLGPDGGIDIRLYQDDSGRPTSIVQCKAWGERYVGVKPIRELLGVMTHEKISKAFFMTSGSYSDEAKAVAQANRITLIDGNMLLMMIQRLSPPERESLLAFAIDGDYATPTCPSCGTPMVAKKGANGRPDFWGCQNYPRCKQILGKRRERPS